MSKKAVIVVDVLHDFVRGAIASPTAETIIEPLQTLLRAARARGLPVMYTCDAHRRGLDAEFSLWPEHAIADTPGAAIIPELAPQAGDYLVPKRRYSGFFQTDLDLLLRELKVDSLIICGLYLTLCVQHTVGDAYNLAYAIEIPADCVAAFAPEEYEASLKYLKEVYGARITDSAELIQTV